jgi:hypothetical protein
MIGSAMAIGVPKPDKLVKAAPLPGQDGAPAVVYGRLEGRDAVLYRGARWDVDLATISVLRGNEKSLLKIFLKTQGYCHFCGDAIDFERRGWAADLAGRWEVDHVIQKAKKGPLDSDNLLPACTRCNRLRSSKSGPSLRRVLFMGLIARDEAYERPGSKIAQQLRDLRIERLTDNWLRRIGKSRRPSRGELEAIKDNLRRFEARALKRYRAQLKREQENRRRLVSSLPSGSHKPKRASVSWTKVLEEVRKDSRTPPNERIADETLRE